MSNPDRRHAAAGVKCDPVPPTAMQELLQNFTRRLSSVGCNTVHVRETSGHRHVEQNFRAVGGPSRLRTERAEQPL